MEQSAGTRYSLIVRLRDARDHQAWTEFIGIYEPLLLRVLGRYGLQDCDARDVCQQVLGAVAKDIEKWQPDDRNRSFRRWLFRIARNRVLKFLEGQRRGPRAAGGTTVQRFWESQPAAGPPPSELFEQEYRQQLFAWAAEQIREEFQPSTWQAFWQTCVQGRPIAEVAGELGMSAGNVYVSRSRIIARLRNKVRSIEDEEA